MEYEHLILLWKAAKGEISNNLGNCLGFPSFSSSHNRDVSEAICLFAFHGRLLHCTAWLAVQAWVVWKTIKWTRWSAVFRSTPVGSVFMLGREASTWVPQQDNHFSAVSAASCGCGTKPGQFRISRHLPGQCGEGSAAYGFLHKVSVGTKAPWEEDLFNL